MSTTTASKQREIHLVSRPEGMPRPENFRLVERDRPAVPEGHFLVRNEWISVDPYMRGRMRESKSYVQPFELNQPMEGGCVGRVVESKHEQYRVGDYVLGNLGWRDYWISDGTGVQPVDPQRAEVRHYLSVLGMTGMTAYVGLLKVGQLKPKETVFVSAASGAVGSIVCQIAKLHDCRVVGSAGSQAKIDWLLDRAKIDAAFDYHTAEDLASRLAELCPQGIDLYFDNVGGDHLQGALDNMNQFGRIVCCGMIATYNDEQPPPGPNNLFKIITKRLRMEGFIVTDHRDLADRFLEQMTGWIKQGQIVWEETITEGLENAPQAFINLFKGEKLGKALVKV